MNALRRPHTAPAAGFLLTVVFQCGCSDRGVALAPEEPTAAPVEVAVAEERSMPVEARAIGTVEAYSTVMVKSRVDGQLLEVRFQEGREVKKGDLLFQIDPRPLEAAVRRAEANQERDEAQAKNARAEADRAERLYASKVVSKDEYDVARTRAEAFDATVRADVAAAEAVRLELNYATIHSPLDGRTGSLKVHEGNQVKADDSVLVTINQIAPIYVGFSLPQKDLRQIQVEEAKGTLRVAAFLDGEDHFLNGEERQAVEGELTFVDNAVDAVTGTIRLKATFANEERRLWPGQFINVSLRLRVEPSAVVVPSQAVEIGQQGAYVFVVKMPELTAELRPITAGRTVGGKTVVEKGLRAGEVVVVDGQVRLVPGMRVELKEASGTKP